MMAAAQPESIQLQDGAFRVTGWTAPPNVPAKGWPSVLVVYAGAGDVPPLLGSYAVEGASLVFRPQFPLASGVRYRAVFRPPGGGAQVETIFAGPPKDTVRRARVERVYPSADVLPSNQLRVYIYFSAPMSRGEGDSRVHLIDATGKILEGVFLPGEELWDPEYRRLTMTFDPGRIKRGLTSNQALGPPIAEGKRYRLVIDRDWPDARGVPMVEGSSKSFRGGPAERIPPNPAGWRVTAPEAGTAGALIVDFPKPMNFPLLQRMLGVSDGHGSVAGTVAIDRQETQWRFTPRENWKAGDYRLTVDTGLEDLAGNHIGQAFDIDVFKHVTEHIAGRTVSVPFSVRARR